MTNQSNNAPSGPEQIFTLHILGLAQQAMQALGLVPDAGSGRVERDLEAARTLIDLLSALEDRTRGNLSAEEARVLRNVLTELRLAFVEVSDRAGGTGTEPSEERTPAAAEPPGEESEPEESARGGTAPEHPARDAGNGGNDERRVRFHKTYD